MAQLKGKFLENGAVTDAKVSSGIDATKIGAGDVDNAELSNLNGVSSNIQTQLDAKEATANKGVAGGYASLDGNGKIPSSQIPAIAITDVFSVADITARDALTVGPGDGEVQEGDVVLVTDASADPAITSGAASYIYNGAGYSLLKAGDEVLSVNGQTGIVSLSTSDISEGTNLYYTEVRVSANTDVAANTAARHDAATIAAGASSQALSITGQEITSNAATGSTAGHMSPGDKTKLDGIEANATADQNANEVPFVPGASGMVATDVQAAILEVETRVDANDAKVSADGSVTSHSDVTNAGSGIIISDAERTKLNGIESGATADQTGAEIKLAYEAELDTNAFTDSEKSKLAGIEAGATGDQNASEVSFVPGASGLVSVNVQDAIIELDTIYDSGTTFLTNHITGVTLDHDGSHINYSPSTLSDWNGSVDPGQVDDGLDQLASRVKTLEGSPASSSASEVLTLIAGDIAAEKVTLSNSPRNASAVVSVSGIVQTPGVDYSISGTDLRFGNLADAALTASDLDPSTGAAPLVAGDQIVINYEY